MRELSPGLNADQTRIGTACFMMLHPWLTVLCDSMVIKPRQTSCPDRFQMLPNCFPSDSQAAPSLQRFPNDSTFPELASITLPLNTCRFLDGFRIRTSFFFKIDHRGAAAPRRKERAAAMKNTNYRLLTLMWISVDQRRLVFPFARSRAVSTQNRAKASRFSLVSLFRALCLSCAMRLDPRAGPRARKKWSGARSVRPMVAPMRVIPRSFLSRSYVIPISFLCDFYVVSIPFLCASGQENIEKTGRGRRHVPRKKVRPRKAEVSGYPELPTGAISPYFARFSQRGAAPFPGPLPEVSCLFSGLPDGSPGW